MSKPRLPADFLAPSRANHAAEYLPTEEEQEKPFIELPGGQVSISDCAAKLFRLIAMTKTLFWRGGAVMVLQKRDDQLLALDVLRPAAARSLFEKYARLMVWRSGSRGEQVLKPTTCPAETADALLASQEAQTLLPPVEGLLNCPVLRVVDGAAVPSGIGYDEVSRLLVTGGGETEDTGPDPRAGGACRGTDATADR